MTANVRALTPQYCTVLKRNVALETKYCENGKQLTCLHSHYCKNHQCECKFKPHTGL